MSNAGTVRIGTSGWSYRAWRGDFYPDGLRQRDELGYLTSRLDAVELNGSFYSLQRATSYASWRSALGAGAEVAVKGSRFVTHMRRLRGDVETALANLFASGLLALGPALGPLLWQLPRDLTFDPSLLAPFLALLPRTHGELAALAARHDPSVLSGDRVVLDVADGVAASRPVRHVLEPRHASFASSSAVALLREHDVGTVLSDNPGGSAGWPVLDQDTSAVRYVRLHGHTRLYESGYATASLDHWARRIRGWSGAGRDVYVFFDNDARGRAPWDAVALRERVG